VGAARERPSFPAENVLAHPARRRLFKVEPDLPASWSGLTRPSSVQGEPFRPLGPRLKAEGDGCGGGQEFASSFDRAYEKTCLLIFKLMQRTGDFDVYVYGVLYDIWVNFFHFIFYLYLYRDFVNEKRKRKKIAFVRRL